MGYLSLHNQTMRAMRRHSAEQRKKREAARKGPLQALRNFVSDHCGSSVCPCKRRRK